MSPLLRRLNRADDVDLRLLVSGGHLVPGQGMTVREIEYDGLPVAERVDIVLASDSPAGIAKSFGLACIGYADALERIAPDLLLLAGDRYEALAVATAALPRLLPIAHIGGGQLTYGSTDEQARHAISKLAHLHFTFTPDAERRLIQMGERPVTVHHVGSVEVDPEIMQGLPDIALLEQVIGVALVPPVFLVTHHPATADPQGSWESTLNLLDALDRFPDTTLVFTAPNVDHGSDKIHAALRQYVDRRGDRTVLVPSLGHVNYLGMVKHADVVIGNSSSGVTAAPMLRTATVNIGSRQEGREKAASVIDAGTSAAEIAKAIEAALDLTDSSFGPAPDYDEIEASLDRMVDLLTGVDLHMLTPKKSFDDTDDAGWKGI